MNKLTTLTNKKEVKIEKEKIPEEMKTIFQPNFVPLLTNPIYTKIELNMLSSSYKYFSSERNYLQMKLKMAEWLKRVIFQYQSYLTTTLYVVPIYFNRLSDPNAIKQIAANSHRKKIDHVIGGVPNGSHGAHGIRGRDGSRGANGYTVGHHGSRGNFSNFLLLFCLNNFFYTNF